MSGNANGMPEGAPAPAVNGGNAAQGGPPPLPQQQGAPQVGVPTHPQYPQPQFFGPPAQPQQPQQVQMQMNPYAMPGPSHFFQPHQPGQLMFPMNGTGLSAPAAYQGFSAFGAGAYPGPSSAIGGPYSRPAVYPGPSSEPAMAAAPYYHFAGAPAKRGPGRPLGSRNKRRSVNNDEDEPAPPPPPATRSRRSNGFQPVEIPEVHAWDYEIAADLGAACSKCALNKAMFICVPCYHYGFCLECLQRHETRCRESDSPVSCMGCSKPVTEFIKYFRASLPE